MALKPLNSTGGFTTGEISQTPIPVVSANGWVVSGNVGNVDTQLRGNGYFISNIQYSNIIGTYGNANVATFLANFGTNTISTTGNITAGNVNGGNAVIANYFIGNGALLTNINAANIIGSYSNSDVANYLASNANVTILTTGNITTAANVSGSYLLGNIRSATGGYDDANVAAYTGALINLTGNVITTANVQGSYLLGNIRSATGGYDDANVAAYTGALTNLTGNVTTTANVSGSYLLGNIRSATGGYDDANVAAYTGALTNLTGNVTTTANVQGSYLLGNGYFLTSINASNIVGAYGNANVKSYLESGDTINANFGTGTVTTSGNVNGGNLVSSANIDGTNVNATKLASSGALTLTTGSNGNIVIQPNGSGNVVLANTFINSVAYPVQDQDAASKVYVDNLVSTAISYHDSVIAATNTTLAIATGGTITYNQPNGVGNGVGATLSTTGSFNLIDSANIQSANARILVKNESNGAFNGIYVWTNATTITRADNEDTAGVGTAFALGLNDYFFVTSGNVNLGTAWIVDAPNTAITFGSSNIQFAQFSQSQVYSANNQAGLVLVGQQFNAKTDNDTTAFDGGGNIIVKAGANLITPNIGNATGSSLNVTGTLTGGNISTAGTVSATGNISGGNLSGTLVTGTLTTAAQPNITSVGTLTSLDVTGTVSGSLLTGTLTTAAQPNITSVGTLGSLDVTGNITSLSGNVSGSYILGNGAFLTGINASNLVGAYGNANVAAYLASGLLTGNIITTANISGQYIAGTLTTAAQPNITSVGTLTTLDVTGNITTSANISGSYILGNGRFLSGLPEDYSNANVAAYLASNANLTILTTGNITTSANLSAQNINGGNTVTANYYIGNGYYLTGLDASNVIYSGANININVGFGNIYSNGYIFANAFTSVTNNITIDTGTYTWIFNNAGNLSGTGNFVTSGNSYVSYIFGNGYNITGIEYGNIVNAYSNTNVQNYLPTYVGNLSASNYTGNFKAVSLNPSYANGTLSNSTVDIGSSVNQFRDVYAREFITPSGTSGNATQIKSSTTGSGVAFVDAGSGQLAAISAGDSAFTGNVEVDGFVQVDQYIQATGNIISSGNISASYYFGNGAFLSGINGANIVGGYGDANVKAFLESGNTINANFGGGTITTTGNISGGNIGGALVSGTLTTAAQPNITTLGTLVSLDVSANITAGGISMAQGNATIGNLYVTGNTTIAGNITQISGNSGQFFGNASTGFNALYAGLPAGFTLLPQSVMNYVTSYNGYSQVNNQNQNGGDEATVDYVLTGNNGDDETYYFDIGYTSSGFDGAVAGANNAMGTAVETNDAYMYTTANVAAGQIGNLILATVDTNSQMRFVVGGRDMGNTALRINSPNTVSANSISGTITVQGDAGINGNINASGYISATGNVSGGNITTAGQVTATGNITGGNITATLITGTLATAAQPNVTSLGTLTALDVTGNITSLSGNISANYLLGNGAFITGLPAGYSNADTQNYLANTGNIQINWTNGGVLIQGSNTANSKTGFTTVTSNSTSATTLVSIDAETNDAVQFLIKGQDTVSGAYQVSKVHSLTDGLTTLDYATFGDVALLGGCGTIQVSLSSGNVVLQVTPKSANTMTWTATYTSI